MSRPHVCLITDPTQWGLLDAIHPAHGEVPEEAEVTWIGLIRPPRRVPSRGIRPLRDLTGLPTLPKDPATPFECEAIRAAQRAWFDAQGWEPQDDVLARHAARCRRLNAGLVAQGVFAGLTEDGTPIPHARRFSLAELGPGATWANVLVALAVFPSMNQARRNGQTAPLTLGRHVVSKKKIVVEIVP